MLKLIGYVLLGLTSFVGVVAACMAATGNLSADGVKKLLAKPEAPVAAPLAQPDDIDGLAEALRKRGAELDKRESKVKEDEERLKQTEAGLEELRGQIRDLQLQIQESLQIEDSNKEKRLGEVATTITSMKSENAAQMLSGWPPEEAAAVLSRIKEKDRGKILDAMPPEQASVLLRSLQPSKS